MLLGHQHFLACENTADRRDSEDHESCSGYKERCRRGCCRRGFYFTPSDTKNRILTKDACSFRVILPSVPKKFRLGGSKKTLMRKIFQSRQFTALQTAREKTS
ncbi:hypothetical protein EVAR_48014_1 [Eumeta japonica]|uniref:Uncharacterized protein n=1 Tax=Eumeta variegata TaxID=151549 RepID=A0A4C1XP97_EUMVA|nr:hypothetical protein EVAR_48014_1 [Eumeta japonica]